MPRWGPILGANHTEDDLLPVRDKKGPSHEPQAPAGGMEDVWTAWGEKLAGVGEAR
ncbi:MAG TPA: hypothetical protein VEB69_03285 [Acidimicrobiia bacterium]|nr:hypothetical protein [Acidimicrobiia bacterium]